MPKQTKVFTVTSPTTLTGLWFRWLVNGVEVQSGPKLQYVINPDRAAKYKITVEAWDIAWGTPKILKTATAIADTRETEVTTWSPPEEPTIKIISHKEGDTVTTSPFLLTVEYTFPNPEGGEINVSAIPKKYLDYVIPTWVQTVIVTNQSGRLTFNAEVWYVKSGQLYVQASIYAPALDLYGDGDYMYLNVAIP